MAMNQGELALVPADPQEALPRARLVSFDNLTEDEVLTMNQNVQEGVQGVKALPGGRVFLVIDFPPGPGSQGSSESDLDPTQLWDRMPFLGDFNPLRTAYRVLGEAVEPVKNQINAINNCIGRKMRRAIKYGLQSIPERVVPIEFFIVQEPNVYNIRRRPRFYTLP